MYLYMYIKQSTEICVDLHLLIHLSQVFYRPCAIDLLNFPSETIFL